MKVRGDNRPRINRDPVEVRPETPTRPPPQRTRSREELSRANTAFESAPRAGSTTSQKALRTAGQGELDKASRRNSQFEVAVQSQLKLAVSERAEAPAAKKVWTAAALKVASPGLARAETHLGKLSEPINLAANLLRHNPRESFAVQLEVNVAGQLVGDLKSQLSTAQRSLRKIGSATSFVQLDQGVNAARRELGKLDRTAGEAAEVLAGVAGQASPGGIQSAAGELRKVRQAAREADGQLVLARGRAEVAGSVAAQRDEWGTVGGNEAARKAKKRAAAGPEAALEPAPAAPGGPAGELTDEDIARIGTGFTGNGPQQAVWDERSMLFPRAREQGLLTPEQDARLNDFANQSLPGAEKKQFTTTDLAVMAKQLGIPPEKMDPNQLGQAARFISEGGDPAAQRNRIAMSMANLTMVANDKLPTLQKSDAAWMAQEIAKIPYKSFNDVKGNPGAEFQKIAAALNTPGESKFKVGKFNVTTVVSDSGKLESTKAKKPGLLSKIGGVVKKLAPIVLTVASFIPATAPFARAIQAGISIYKAVKAKSLLGVVSAAAGALGGASGVIGKVAKIAGGAAKALQGIQQVRKGGIAGVIGGLASIAGGVAQGLSAAASNAASNLAKTADKLSGYADKLGKAAQGAGAVEGYVAANKAVGQAKQALEAARASGDPAAIAAAVKDLDSAERGKKGALLSGLATGASLAAGAVGGKKDADGNPVKSGLQTGLGAAARGLNLAGNVVTRDFESAAANAIGFASSFKRGPDTRLDANGKARHNDLGDVSAMADAALAYRQASKSEAAASQQVSSAERALEAARRSGDPAAIRAASEGLKQARRGAEGALLSGISAGYGLLDTASSIGANRAAGRAAERVFAATKDDAASLRQTSERARAELAQLASDPQAKAKLEEVDQARRDFDRAMLTGDAAAIQAAGGRLFSAEKSARQATEQRQRVPASQPAAPGLTTGNAPPEAARLQASVSWDDYRRGQSGEDVKTLQRQLNQELGLNLAADGAFGPATEAAVREYQRRNDLTVDGIVGPKTLEQLGLDVNKPGGEQVVVRGASASPAPSPSRPAASLREASTALATFGQPGAKVDPAAQAAAIASAQQAARGSEAYHALTAEQRKAFDQTWERLGENRNATSVQAMRNLVGALDSGQLKTSQGQQAIDDYLALSGKSDGANPAGYNQANAALYLAGGRNGVPATAPGGKPLDVDTALQTAMTLRSEIRSDNTLRGYIDLVGENLYNDYFADQKVDPAKLGTQGTRGLAGGRNESLMATGVVLPDGRQSALESARILASAAQERRWGNCQELAALAAVKLHDRGYGAVEIFARDGDPNAKRTHAFVVVGRAPGSDPNDPRTWGSNALIVDPWADNGRAYPANRLNPGTLGREYPLPGYGRINVKFRLPDPGVQRPIW